MMILSKIFLKVLLLFSFASEKKVESWSLVINSGMKKSEFKLDSNRELMYEFKGDRYQKGRVALNKKNYQFVLKKLSEVKPAKNNTRCLQGGDISLVKNKKKFSKACFDFDGKTTNEVGLVKLSNIMLLAIGR